MQAYQIVPGTDIQGLQQTQLPPRALGTGEVRVRVHAVSLNYRDLMLARGHYQTSRADAVIPCSDGAGEVLEVAAGVSRFEPGDRVASAFFPNWIDGALTAQKIAGALGADSDGMLAREVVLPEQALVRIPTALDFAQASTLPCAGVTAWNALFETAALRPGDSVLLLGTGGVSIVGLQLAKAAGLRALITSSSDAKLARARELGADETINYRNEPEWQDAVRRMTRGEGVDAVIEVGGQGTLRRSLAATRMGGTVAVIGGLSGFGAAEGFGPGDLIRGARRMAGIFVGSRTMAENLTRFVDVTGIQPVVDRVFAFDQARDAYEYLAGARHFGKVVIGVTD